MPQSYPPLIYGFVESGQGVPGNWDSNAPQAAVAVAPMSGVSVTVGDGVNSSNLASSVGARVKVGDGRASTSPGGQVSTLVAGGQT